MTLNSTHFYNGIINCHHDHVFLPVFRENRILSTDNRPRFHFWDVAACTQVASYQMLIYLVLLLIEIVHIIHSGLLGSTVPSHKDGLGF